ncbi:hypothetical protein TNCV_1480351 [Trichonephila clavipes]|nr:hypothetical protein TNCV_1480351 [Trichonephila clavipes]
MFRNLGDAAVGCQTTTNMYHRCPVIKHYASQTMMSGKGPVSSSEKWIGFYRSDVRRHTHRRPTFLHRQKRDSYVYDTRYHFMVQIR